MITLYKDIIDIFRCELKVDGTSLANSKARLLMKFKDRSLVFDGDISSEGTVEVHIPELRDIDADTCECILEVIAANTYFEAWKSEVALSNKQNIAAKSVSVNEPQATITVKDIEIPTQDPDDDIGMRVDEEPVSVPDIEIESEERELTDNTPKYIVDENSESMLRDNVSDKNALFVKDAILDFNNLDDVDQERMLDKINNMTFNVELCNWARNVFVDPDSIEAKISMKKIIEKWSN